MLIQLPNDAKLTGVKQTKPFTFEQVFKSESASFIGTEKEFLTAGKAYSYVSLDKFTRLQVQS
jgi:hypothetical protein